MGLLNKDLHDAFRFEDVCAAISRYFEAGLPVPIEWVKEYNNIVDQQHAKSKNK
jgi:hypothetical protein